jgi:glycosyltransferase involved in cell wall biosynthesis
MRVAIFIPAYEAERTLCEVVGRIPPDVRDSIDEILVLDDASRDRTLAVGRDLARRDPKVTVLRNRENLGYGGTNKRAYSLLARRGIDAYVVLHGDCQYAPEHIADLIEPLRGGTADIVLGSRILAGARAGGMPRYKLLGNRLLTTAMNRCLRLDLTDYHTGYVATTCAALDTIDFESCSDGHEISAEFLVRAAAAGLRIVEVPTPTYYGPGTRSMSLGASCCYGANVLRLLKATRRDLLVASRAAD